MQAFTRSVAQNLRIRAPAAGQLLKFKAASKANCLPHRQIHTSPPSKATTTTTTSTNSSITPPPQPSTTSTTAAKITSIKMADAFLQAVKDRHTYYQLSPESPISDDRILEITKTAVLNAPSSFNSQSTRLVVLLGDHHKKLWDITRETLFAIIPEAQREATGGRIDGFRNGYGTILFLEDPQPVNELKAAFATYADKFPQWSEHTSAIHQFILWTALEAEGFGANLQHYNPLIDDKVKEEWGINKDYKLIAQLVFGKPSGPQQDRPKIVTFKPLEETLRVFK